MTTTRLNFNQQLALKHISISFQEILSATMMTERIYVVPGEILDDSSVPLNSSLPLKVGPGLRHIPQGTLIPTVAGQLFSDDRKNVIWVECDPGRVSSYIPSATGIEAYYV